MTDRAPPFPVRAAALAMLLASFWGAPARAEGDTAKGEETATQWCARCHVIGEANRYGGINSTPSFYIMARKPDTYSAKLLTFQERRPHAALKFDVTEQDLEDILAYVATLEKN